MRPATTGDENLDTSVPVSFFTSSPWNPDTGYRRPASTAALAANEIHARALELSQSETGLRVGFSMADLDPMEHRRARRRVLLERDKTERQQAWDLVARIKEKRFLQVLSNRAPVVTCDLKEMLQERKSQLYRAEVPVFRDAARSWADYSETADEWSHTLDGSAHLASSRATGRSRKSRKEPPNVVSSATIESALSDADTFTVASGASSHRTVESRARKRTMAKPTVPSHIVAPASHAAPPAPEPIDEAPREDVEPEAPPTPTPLEDVSVQQRRAMADRLYKKQQAKEQRQTTLIAADKRKEDKAAKLASLKDRQAQARAEHKKVKLRQQYVAARYKNAASIEAKAQKLAELSGKVAQRAYQAESGAAGGDATGGADEQRPADDNVVDADFEEVKDKK